MLYWTITFFMFSHNPFLPEAIWAAVITTMYLFFLSYYLIKKYWHKETLPLVFFIKVFVIEILTFSLGAFIVFYLSFGGISFT